MLQVEHAKLKILALIGLFVFMVSNVVMAGGPETMLYNKSGFLITANAGGAIFQNQHFNSTIDGLAPLGFQADINNQVKGRNTLNFLWNAGIGWMFNGYFWVDVMYNYTHFSLLKHSQVVSIVGGLRATTFGLMKGYSSFYMFDVYLNLLALFRNRVRLINPYIGVGVGASRNSTKDISRIVQIVPTTTQAIENASRTDFAYRVMVGLNFYILTQFFLNIQYSYMELGKYAFGSNITSNGGVFTAVEIANPRFNIHANTFTVGATYLF